MTEATRSSDARSFIVDGSVSGGTNTSHTIVVPALEMLLAALPPDAESEAYAHAALIENALGKPTDGSRRRTFRYLKELYILDPEIDVFQALRDLWDEDFEGRPLLAGLCALARDASFRASSSAILRAVPGEQLASADLAAAVEERFPSAYSPSTLAKIGRNTFSSWEQTGHLKSAGARRKFRTRATCRPPAVAFALYLGHLEGARGDLLFDTFWTRVLDQPRSHLYDLAFAASQHGLVDFRHAGGVVDVGFEHLERQR